MIEQPEMNELPGRVWPRKAKRAEDGSVRLAGVPVAELAAEFGTPLFVIDEDEFRSRCREMVQAMTVAEGELGRGRVHYAAKAFLSVEIARWVEQEGLSLDVCTGGELAVALYAGFPTDRITLHGNNKSVAELELAVRAGVGHVVLDSDIEITRLDEIAGRAHAVVDVLIRVTPGVHAHTHEYISTAHEDQKFGFSIGSGDALAAVLRVFEADHLRLVGLHSHIGSQIFDTEGFELATRRMLELIGEIVAKFGAVRAAGLSMLDLGGGFGISYLSGDDPPPVGDLVARLRRIVVDECDSLGLPVPEIVVEPGRAIVGPAGVTLYEVGTVKDVQVDNDPDTVYRKYISVDGGMSDNIRPALYGADYDCRLVSRVSQVPGAVARVVGKHCETGDVIIQRTSLPADIAPGDLLGVAATGAYCYSLSSRYNMVPRPAVVAVREGSARLLLRRETMEDLLGLEAD